MKKIAKICLTGKLGWFRGRPLEAPAALFAVALLVLASVMSLAGTDLVLPAVPVLPAALGGSATQAQLVLAAYSCGSGLGLLAFGALGARFDQRWVLLLSLLGFAALSLLASLVVSQVQLIAVRLGQGFAAAAGPVFAPGLIRAAFSPAGAMRALGVLGSLESLAPALAPVLGVWLLALGGWQLSFRWLALVAAALALATWWLRAIFPAAVRVPVSGSYGRLLTDPVFLRYALTQALTLGGLLVFVFGAPVVMTGSLGGTLTDFIILQLCGIFAFILAANLAPWLVQRVGPEPVITCGTIVAAVGALGILCYGFVKGDSPGWLVALFVPMNLGLGLRGPPGFYRAVLAARGDDARGSALVMLFALLTAAGGTALVAPWIDLGLVPVATVAAFLATLSVVGLFALPELVESTPGPEKRAEQRG